MATITASSVTPCAGTTDTLFANTTTGNTYQWSYSLNNTSYADIAGATSSIYATTQNGYYKVFIKRAGCQVTSNFYSLNFDPLPPSTISLPGVDTICPGQSVLISANSGNQLTYQWAKDSVAIPGFTGTSAVVTANGNYTVTETDQYGCSATSPVATVVQRNAPVPAISPAGSFTVCDSTSTILSFTASAHASYTWSKLSGASYQPIPGAASNSYVASTTGIYEVIAVYNNGCTETSAPVTATFATTPAKPAVTSNSPICLGSSLHFSVGNAMPGYTYSWSGPNNFSSANQNASAVLTSATDSGRYIVRVSNKGCFNADTLYVAVTCIDSVWPGDVNADHVVNNIDALDLALGFGYTGYPRNPSYNTTFAGQFCTDWPGDLLPNVNMKHADCNGDGGIGYPDTAAIYANYGDAYQKSSPAPLAKITTIPSLYFDLTNYPYLKPGESVSIPIKLGSDNNLMYSIAGIAATVKISGLILTNPPTITYPVSWLGVPSNTLRFAHQDKGGNTTANAIGWAYARTNHTNVTGEGTIANLNFVVPTGIGFNSWAFLNFDNVTIIDNEGTVITGYNVVNDTAIANPTAINTVAGAAAGSFASIFPNPSAPGTQAYLKVELPAPATLSLSITDVTGRAVWQQTLDGQGQQDIALPTNFNTGIYFIHLQRSTDNFIQVLKWLKN